MENGRSHDERNQKHATRIDRELQRNADELPKELDRRARSTDPAPTEKAAEEDSEKRALFFEIADNLAVHATIEERHFYPAVRERQTE